jgi:hypothetical protein
MNTVWILLYMLLAASIGLLFGSICGKQAAEEIEELRNQLHHVATTQDRQLKKMRSVLNDAHKHILAVSKGLEKPAR